MYLAYDLYHFQSNFTIEQSSISVRTNTLLQPSPSVQRNVNENLVTAEIRVGIGLTENRMVCCINRIIRAELAEMLLWDCDKPVFNWTPRIAPDSGVSDCGVFCQESSKRAKQHARVVLYKVQEKQKEKFFQINIFHFCSEIIRRIVSQIYCTY